MRRGAAARALRAGWAPGRRGEDRHRPGDRPAARVRLRRAGHRCPGPGGGQRPQWQAVRRATAHRERSARAGAGRGRRGRRPRRHGPARTLGSPRQQRGARAAPVTRALSLLSLVTLAAGAAHAAPPPIVSWQEVGGHVGEVVTVEGEVATAATVGDTWVLEFAPEDAHAFRVVVL